jgi:hypothetical protein
MKIGDRHSLAALQTALKQETDSNTQKAIALAVSLLQKQPDFSLEDDWTE